MGIFIKPKPEPPSKPVEPSPPAELVTQTKYLGSLYDRSLQDLIDSVPEGISWEDIIFKANHRRWHDECDFRFDVCYQINIPNPNLERDLQFYKSAMTIYNNDLKFFEKELGKYNKAMETWEREKAVNAKLNAMSLEELENFVHSSL